MENLTSVATRPIRRALLSVSDKQGLTDFARGLIASGVELISSGGTAAALRAARLPVRDVSEVTGFPEMLDGRVKTLHPKIFGGILARAESEHESQLLAQGIERIDLVVVNLYPFAQTLARPGVSHADLVEQIDIGGPSLIRAAAKNYPSVLVISDPVDYDSCLERIRRGPTALDAAFRCMLAAKAFAHTAWYDGVISNYFQQLLSVEAGPLPTVLNLQLVQDKRLRYGENPHQAAAFYRPTTDRRWTGGALHYQQLQGKELSYNNLLDTHAAWDLVRDLPQNACCIVKHMNPCGAAAPLNSGSVTEAGTDRDVGRAERSVHPTVEAFKRALEGDPVSAFGGIVAVNGTVEGELARALTQIFFEVVVAPKFDEDAQRILAEKKNLRVLEISDAETAPSNAQQQTPHPHGLFECRTALGGVLIQARDTFASSQNDLDQAVSSAREGGLGRVVTKRNPAPSELVDLAFAWRVCKHVKSNAIVVVKDQQLVGVGAGQMSRVDAAKLATGRAVLPVAGAVAASDAFFPFRDGLDVLASAGITAVIQPGGSVRDEEVIAAADTQNVSMVLTGERHFRH